jgi:hypothetical protein
VVNGQFVEQLGAGMYHMSFNEENLRNFFENLDQYRKNLESYNPGNQKQTLKRIDKEIQKLLPKSRS